MNILLLGSGGREHALAWKIAGSPLLTKLWCAPGNAGIAKEAECIALDVADHAAVIAFCRANKVDLVVVGEGEYTALELTRTLLQLNADAVFRSRVPNRAISSHTMLVTPIVTATLQSTAAISIMARA